MVYHEHFQPLVDNMKKILITCLTVIISGSAFYFSTGFHNVWWLMWIAPIPVLIYTYYERFFTALVVAYIVGLSFGLNTIVGYWSTGIPSSAFIFGMFWQSAKWTMAILISRYLMRHGTSYFSIFAYPTCLALFEWLETFTIQGTFNTIAYSQLQILPVVQLASLTGYIGISFMLSIFSSAVAYAIIFRQEKMKSYGGLSIGLVIVISSLAYGFYRIHSFQQQKSIAQIKVGLISVSRSPEKLLNPRFANDIWASYFPLMLNASLHGAEVILLPEESFAVNSESAPIYKRKFASFANQHHVKLIIGIKDYKQSGSYNATWVFDDHGQSMGEYYKRHFVPGFENDLTPGIGLLTFNINGNKSGIAICRDMDYLKPANNYGALGTQILFVPAWDFDADAEVHAAGAWMRGIENGYTLVRSARDGFLSVSTPTGEIIAKVPAMNPKGNILITVAPIYQNQSVFAKHQWWFLILLCLLLVITVIYSLTKK